MGRGRAKAKQTKVARELKYRTGGIDVHALQAELANGGGQLTPVRPTETKTEPDDDDDPYVAIDSAYAHSGAYDDDAEDDWLPSPRRP